MEKSTKIGLGISILAVVISFITIAIDIAQNNKIGKLQYELNSLNYKPTIKVHNVLLTSFKERMDSINLSNDTINELGVIKKKSHVETDVTFNLENIGNTNAKIIAAFCIDTVSGDDKLRDVIYRNGMNHSYDSSNNEFYSYWQLQPNEKDELKFHINLKFINNEIFTVHLLLLYENELDILYDTYYWAKFQKKDMLVDVWIDPQNGEVVKANFVNNPKEYVKFIDDNVAYKVYSEKEKEQFDKLIKSIRGN